MQGRRKTENTMGRIFIIGGANIDICGFAQNQLRDHDSNPGTIEISFGGVGRNIAEICALLGADISFATVFSSDSYGTLLKNDCEQLGMDCSLCTVTDEWPSSMYIAVMDHEGDMKIAMSDMRILRAFTAEMMDRVLKRISKDDIIIIDANLDMECIRYIADHAPCMIAADPVSTAKASRLMPVIGRIGVFKPNRYEAEELSGIRIADLQSASEALDWFTERGVREVIISLADQGVLLAAEGRKVLMTHRRVEVENANGGGDSLLAAYICQRIEGVPCEKALAFAAAAAVCVIEMGAGQRCRLTRAAAEKALAGAEIRENYL